MKDSYKILGIDPGTNLLGYAVLEVKGKELSVPALGVVKLTSFEDHTTKLKEIFLQIQEIIETYLPISLAIEAPFYGKNVQSMLKLGRAQGVAMAAGITMGLEITEYAPKKIKQSITGSGNASKEQVAFMLNNLLKMKFNQKYLDATDALGAAYCHYNQMGNNQSSKASKKYTGWESFVKDNPDKVK